MKRGGRGAAASRGRAPPAKKRKANASAAEDSEQQTQDGEDDLNPGAGITFAGHPSPLAPSTKLASVSISRFIHFYLYRLLKLKNNNNMLGVQTRARRQASARSSTHSTRTSQRTSSASLSEG
jgi:hypothetical protein